MGIVTQVLPPSGQEHPPLYPDGTADCNLQRQDRAWRCLWPGASEGVSISTTGLKMPPRTNAEIRRFHDAKRAAQAAVTEIHQKLVVGEKAAELEREVEQLGQLTAREMKTLKRLLNISPQAWQGTLFLSWHFRTTCRIRFLPSLCTRHARRSILAAARVSSPRVAPRQIYNIWQKLQPDTRKLRCRR